MGLGSVGLPTWNAGSAAVTTDQLLSAVAQGDQRAFATFYDRLAAPVMGLVRSVVRDEAQSQEVVREVFVHLWRTAPRFRPGPSGAQDWAMAIAHRRAVERVRAGAGKVARGLDTLDGQVGTSLRALTEPEREAIVLAYYQALTHRQVADTLRVTTGTVQYRLRTGLRRLRDCPTRDRTST